MQPPRLLLLSILAAFLACASARGQTLKSLMFNSTNGQVIANTGTNVLTFTNQVQFSGGEIGTYVSGFYGFGVSLNLEERKIQDSSFSPDILSWNGNEIYFGLPLNVGTNATTTRANLGFNTNLNTLWTATNAAAARSAVGVGSFNSENGFSEILDESNNAVISTENGIPLFYSALNFASTNARNTTRTNLGLGWVALTNTNAQNFYTNTLTSWSLIAAAVQENPSSARNAIGLALPALTNTNVVNFRNAILPSYSENSSKVLRVNSGGTDVEWAEIAGGTNTNLLTLPLSITNGGTGSTNASQARVNLGVPIESGTGTTSVIVGMLNEGSVEATGSLSFVMGGVNNRATGIQTGIIGGGGNNAGGTNSIVLGGTSSDTTASQSFAAGSYAKATNFGSFVWSDGSSTNAFGSQGSNSFNLRATGGMSLDLGTNGIVFRNNNGITNTRKSILPAYQTFTFTTNTNSTVTTNTNSFAGKILAVNSNATDVEWIDQIASTNTNSQSAAFILRTNNTTRTNTTTDADEVLTYSFPSEGKYFVTLGHLMTVQTNSGLKARIIATNATVYGTWSFSASTLTNDYSYALGSISGDRMFHQWFIVDASTNASVTLGWGQVSGTNTTSILSGSFMKIEKFTPQ